MEQKTNGLYPSAPVENSVLKQRLEKTLDDVNSFYISINNLKEMIAYFKAKNHKSKKNYKNYENLTTILISFDTIVNIATTSAFITLSVTRIGLLAIPTSTATSCGLSIGNQLENGNEVFYGIVMKRKINIKNNVIKVNKQSTLSINYTAKVYKVI